MHPPRNHWHWGSDLWRVWASSMQPPWGCLSPGRVSRRILSEHSLLCIVQIMLSCTSAQTPLRGCFTRKKSHSRYLGGGWVPLEPLSNLLVTIISNFWSNMLPIIVILGYWGGGWVGRCNQKTWVAFFLVKHPLRWDVQHCFIISRKLLLCRCRISLRLTTS